MISVGFIGTVSKEWMGAVNYYKNLLYAISTLEDPQIEPVVFIGKKAAPEIKAMFGSHAKVVESSIFDRKSLGWLSRKIQTKLFGYSISLSMLLKKHGIQVLSHSSLVRETRNVAKAYWIPDFQHVRLPQMFSEREISQRNIDFIECIKKSDIVFLSSYDALKDFRAFSPQYYEKGRVLHFVSQPDRGYFDLSNSNERHIREKYGIYGDFYFLPNQFWKHKNHITVFQAVKFLKEKGGKFTLVCTGYLKDYRNLKHVQYLLDFIKNNGLKENIKLLGLVDYSEVYSLIKFSKAVINPSLFEGWSSTVEECKSVGKQMILSDIGVHKEQYPEAVFFERESATDLATALETFTAENKIDSSKTCRDIEVRTQLFANLFQDMILSLHSNRKE